VHAVDVEPNATTAGRGPTLWGTTPPLRWSFFLLFAVLYLYAFPYFDRLRSAQEMPRLLLTQEIVDRGTFQLDRRLVDMGSRNDLSIGPDGHYYANKSPGPSFVAIPAYLVCKLLGVTSIPGNMWAIRFGAVTLPALLFLPFFYRLTGRFTTDERARRAALAAYAIAGPVVPYSMILLAHQLAAVCLGGAFYAAVTLVRSTPRWPRATALVGGFLAGASLLMDYQAALAAPVVGIYLIARSRQRLRDLPPFIAGGIPPVVALGAYHTVCFGSPFRISYGYGLDTAPKEGVMGFIGPNWDAFWYTLFTPSNGLFVLAPWAVLAIVGAVAIWRDPERRARVGPEAVAAASLVGVYLLFLSSMLPYMTRGGWAVGPRQLVGALPFVGWLAAAGFEVAGRRVWTRVLAFAAVIAGAVVFLAAATTYPHWPDGLRNPLYELVFRLLWRGYAVHSLGTAVGLHGIASLLPLYVFAFCLCLWLLLRGWARPLRVGLLATLLAVGLVATHRIFPLTGTYSNKVWAFVTSTWEPPVRK
jgi:hypothetical protein